MDRILRVFILISAYILLNNISAFTASTVKNEGNDFTFNNYAHNYEFRSGVDKKSLLLNKRIKLIEKIPDSVQRIVDRKEPITVIFFNGCLTDNPELINRKGIKPRGYTEGTLDKVMMCQCDGKVYIGIEGDFYDDGTDYTLHEYGHVYDDRIGGVFYGKSLSSLEKVNDIIKKKKFLLNKYYHNPREFIAFSVQNYYYSKFTKMYLKNNFNEIYEMLKEIEEKSTVSVN